LAHSQWSYILQPGIDSAIDATCGNGYDSCFLASTLFSSSPDGSNSRLICVDIQQQACETTRKKLAEILDPDILENCVSILQTSHAPLPRPQDDSSVALVCFNLGYLPNVPGQKDRYSTQMESTLASMTDAALMLRVGGMLSVVTYPKTNPNEDYAVHAFMEALSLLSSKERNWQEFLAEMGPDPVASSSDGSPYSARDTAQQAMNRIVAEGQPQLAWRVFEHEMMGRALAPILLTATRIK
jgi:hypothetical protein